MQMPLNNTSSDQSERSNTTARITQCHAATHTWALSSPGLSTNRDKQHEICADSALRGSGLLQDRTQGWLASLRLSPVSNKVKETTDIPCPNCEEPGKRGVTSLLGTCVSCCDYLLICCYWLTHPYQVSDASKLSRGGQVGRHRCLDQVRCHKWVFQVLQIQ